MSLGEVSTLTSIPVDELSVIQVKTDEFIAFLSEKLKNAKLNDGDQTIMSFSQHPASVHDVIKSFKLTEIYLSKVNSSLKGFLNKIELNETVNKKPRVDDTANPIEQHSDYQEMTIELKNLFDKLKIAKDNTEKALYYKKIGIFYQNQAEKDDKSTLMASISFWQHARNNFYESIKHDNNKNSEVVLRYSKCLIYLADYTESLNHLLKYKDVKDVTSHVEYYLALGTAYRHIFKYSEAEKWLVKGLAIDSNHVGLKNELQLVQNLIKFNAVKKADAYKNDRETKSDGILIDQNYYQTRNNENNQKYKILSVDGGGIRGLIPAFWLCEIEKKTHRPMSHLFNMMAGTSTGGIISAGLSVPENNDGYTPKYRASNLLEIYSKEGKDIFTYRNMTHRNIIGSTYKAEGRYNVLKKYFDDARLDSALTEVVIPACSENNLISTYIFNRHDSRKDPFRNDRYIDALMATSAAPTYFPPHFIPGKGIFNDGGVHANNPAGLASSEAFRYGVPSHKFFVLSMGTGGFIPDPFDAFGDAKDRSITFWAQHLQDVALQAQVGNTDMFFSNALGKKNYKRWQVWLEDEIKLDGYDEKSITKLLESANQLVEKLYSTIPTHDCMNLISEAVDIHLDRLSESDNNEFNKLIEFLKQ